MNKIVGTVSFKKFTGEKLENVAEYVKKYCDEHKNVDIEILIGTDSQNKARHTTYSTVIVLYTPSHGGHCIFKRWKTPKETVRQVRLLKEVEESLNTANELVEAGCKKPKYIDIDINPKYLFNEETFKKILKLKSIFLEFDEDGSRKMELDEMEEMFHKNKLFVSTNELIELFCKGQKIKKEQIKNKFV